MASPIYPWIDWLIPKRTDSKVALSNYSLAGGGAVYVDIEVPDGYNHVIVQVEVVYGANAVNGVRIFWLYSNDGQNFDTRAGARSLNRYIDPIVVAGAHEILTLDIPALSRYVRIFIKNKDDTVTQTVTIRYHFARL